MKTKLLKELRDEAYKVYGIKGRLELPTIEGADSKKVEGAYIVGERLFSDRDVVEVTLKAAKKRLRTLRIEYCIRKVEEKRISEKKIRFGRL